VRSPGRRLANAPPPDTVITLYSLSSESFLTNIFPGGTDSLVHPNGRNVTAI
jgi:hypothetical protein